MIDLGSPFSRKFSALVDSLVDSLQQGVEQSGRLDLLYRQGTTAYPLRGLGPVTRLADQITGRVDGKPAVFDLGTHYGYAVGQLVWNAPPTAADADPAAGWYPDNNSPLTVGYYYSDLPSGLTDFNAGSVVGTLVRAMAREFTLLYEQMDQAYKRAFIDHAQGAALDNVVALLGIARHPALPAQGEVTFSLRKAPPADVQIAPGTRVADARGRLFKVAAPGTIKATLAEACAASGKVVQTKVAIGSLVHVRERGGTADLPTVATKAGKPFGDDGSTVTLAAVPTSSSLIVTYQPKTPRVTVPVIALATGPEGNLGAGSLTVMPTPPRGVDGGVVNERALSGGTAAEGDDALRERAKHALESAGRATLDAIRYAVLQIDGVDRVEVRDFTSDETIPLGEVWVRYATGTPQSVGPLVEAVVDRTRAAGIKARVSQVASLTLVGTFYVIPDGAGSGKGAYDDYRLAVGEALKALGIGEPVSPRKLASLVFQVPGLADVAEVQLDYVRGQQTAQPVDKDPFVVGAGEQARPDRDGLHVVPVRTLAAATATLAADGTLTVTVRALAEDEAPIRWRRLQLAVLATVRAKPKAAPNQPLAQVAQVTGTLGFTDADQAQPSFPPVKLDLASLDRNTIELVVEAAAYPGILPGTTPLGT